MRLFSLTIPKPIEAAAGACHRRFALAAGLGALPIFLYLAPAIDTIPVNDRVVATTDVQTLLWITVVAGLAIATPTALDRFLTNSGLRELARGHGAPADPNQVRK